MLRIWHSYYVPEAYRVETPDVKDMAFLLRAGGLQVNKDLPLMNLIRRLISLDPITEEELADWYAVPEPVAGEGNNQSQNKDPIGHAMDDGDQNFEGK
jgi:hypothetical protein